MTLPQLPSLSFLKGILFSVIVLVTIISGYWIGRNYDALVKTVQYPEAVRSMEVKEILVATYSGQLQK
ncbi:hypothetical protein HY345_01705 [Candidatus Microgenomates bacterium]|nr:hypothetical protein [Candidatus Microgenomates bacterium]